jgi:hypothetical protein
MVIAVSPWKYQILHPWHWLTYGQNAAALQGVCALFAAIGLLFYVLDTRRMRQVGELTRRASMTPIFTARDIIPHCVSGSDDVFQISMTVRNVGEGVATVLWAWYQPVSAHFSVFDSGILTMSKSAKLATVPTNDLMKGESTVVDFVAFNPADPTDNSEHVFNPNIKWLFVVDSIGQAQGKHQLKILLKSIGNDVPGEMIMAHALGDTFGEWVVKSVKRGIEILLGIKTEILKLFK